MDMLISHLRSLRAWKKAVRCLGRSFLGMLLGLPIAGYAQVTRSSVAGAPIPTPSGSTNQLMQLNSSIQAVVAKASAAVVQIKVAGYGQEDEHAISDAMRIVRHHAVGSGIIVDPDGYILTNAHVVEGAQRIRVILPPRPVDSQLELRTTARVQILDARLIGKNKESDIALLKVEANGLPYLHLRATVPVHQGELVFAIGSPEGLQDTVTMGVVSAVTRQVDPNDPIVYVQTDAAINPGNSGGPLIDVNGNIVGMNTMMLSHGGGSEGLGFALPAAIVDFDYEHLRKHGHVQRVMIGISAQDITPPLASGLGLARNWGAIVSDVQAEGPAKDAGLQPGDIVFAVDGRPIRGLPDLLAALYLHSSAADVKIDVLRGGDRLLFNVPPATPPDDFSHLSDVPADQQSLIPRLGVLVTELDARIAPLVHAEDLTGGVVVIGETEAQGSTLTGLAPGDVIRALNNAPVGSVSQLRAMVHNLKPGDAVALKVQQGRKMRYVAFELD
jgi:serine protease Do